MVIFKATHFHFLNFSLTFWILLKQITFGAILTHELIVNRPSPSQSFYYDQFFGVNIDNWEYFFQL